MKNPYPLIKNALAERYPRLAVMARYVRMRRKRFVALFLFVAHTAGALTSVQALMNVRTAQGATAWVVALNTFPYVAVPAYWVFGRTKFQGYVSERRGSDTKSDSVVAGLRDRVQQAGYLGGARGNSSDRLLERLAKLPATTANDVQLLRNSEEIFPSIFEGIDQAKDYVLVQFYIVRDDELGQKLKDHLISARGRGVRVHFLYDEIGSYGMPDKYAAEMKKSGIEILPFNSMKGWNNRFQINFRNHRKLVVTDGRCAWTGGANIGDEYSGGDEDLSPWHDTMVKIQGPAVQTVQVSFFEDWIWASGNELALQWEPAASPAGGNQRVHYIPSGPADAVETCTLYFLQLIHSANRRLWIATPYFVPDEQFITALELAALRGVEVRILVTDQCDSQLVDLSGWAHVERLGALGVRFYRHGDGFMHQKVTLVDDDTATVGSANIDNRSFRLNFEGTVEVRDQAFATKVREMFERDFKKSRLVPVDEPTQRGFFFMLKVRAANLLSPIQ
ncbi:cardiolipin synthase [Luteolibacter sp. GHJ8]|uniref:Cardiolipin synthase n=1 Tax=Luteolibacter rhizosphaerae TaxID=2989719 RepID=A0ABT3G8Z1_9BACT|nr:cardiolipin synthase [Luteolibacter rhizosphaerae]MCW1916300.1 cardiolipin synthase [Luteolibacter rhizosphaerae]